MPEPSRRAVLDKLMWTSLAATATACLAPVPFYLLPPADAKSRSSVVAGTADSLPVGSARKFLLGAVPAILLNDGALRAFDARCTHQRCVVNWDAPARRLVCPCHGAEFSSAGEPLSGPADRPLAGLTVRVAANGDVVVTD